MRARWLSRRAVGLHVTLAICLPGFLYLGWWQLHRALNGNSLSWAYTFEWPLFSGYAIYMWWRLVHDIAADRAAGPVRPLRERPPSPDDDAALAAYNAYLAELAANDAEHRGGSRRGHR